MRRLSKDIVVDNIEISLEQGEILTLIGPNGAGKSTFLKILCGEIEPTTGEVVISKEDRLQSFVRITCI